MNFIKNYWTHFIGIIYLVVINLLFYHIADVFSMLIEDKIQLTFIKLFLILIIISIVVWIGIIGFIIHDALSKDNKNKILDGILIYLLNIYYIPCYYLKNIRKDAKLALHNTIYIIIMVLLTISTCFSLGFGFYKLYQFDTNYKESKYKTIFTDDRLVKFEIPNYYESKNVGEYDLYFTNEESVIGVFIYDDDEAENVLKHQEDFIIKTRDNVKIIDKNEYTLNNKKVITHTLKGEKDGNINIYKTNVITFDKYPNYVIYVTEICLEENSYKYEDIFKKIIDNISLNTISETA